MSHTCDFINENGYSVCINCGITETEDNHYWSEDQNNHDVYKRNEIREISKKTKGLKKNWYYLLRINKMYIRSKSHVYVEVLYILNQLPFTPKIKKDLYQYIISKNFKSYKDVWNAFYKIICDLDLPITTVEYIKILNAKRKKAYNPFTKNNINTVKVRKYYWYITKSIEKARKILDFSHEQAHDLYKIVFNYYNLIRFGMFKSTNPINLIQNLVYYTIREILKPNQQVFNKNNFGLLTLCYITQLVKYIIEIKELNLDSEFSKKLTINARNMKIYNTIII